MVSRKDPITDNHGFVCYKHHVEFTENMIYTKCKEDWRFYDSKGKIIPNPLKVNVKTIASNSNYFCFHKNTKLNKQVVYYESLHDHPDWCSTRAKPEILA